MTRKHFILPLLLLLGSMQAIAQNMVRGTVTDTEGEPLIGVTVSLKGTSRGAVTNANGQYSITVSTEDAILTFSYLGMEPYKTAVRGRNTINVVMYGASNELAEVAVVSTGYQRLSRERSTAAFGLVDSTQLNRQMHSNLLSSLEGQVAGLRMNINPNTGEMSPVLRGVGTFSNAVGTKPLIVIDNMPANIELSEINPYNVESITVLKDAAAASIYGALAANGVIVVTTKQAKSKGTHVSVNADWYITTKPNFKSLRLASTSQIIDYQTEVLKARAEESGSIENYLDASGLSYYNPLFQLYRDQANGVITTDAMNATIAQWRNNDYYEQYRQNAWRTAVTQRYNTSLSHHADKSRHFASFNFETNKNRIITDRSNAFSLYYKSNYALTDWLGVNLGIDARITHSTTPYSSYTSYNIQQRYEQILDADGNRYTSPYVNFGGYTGGRYNGNVVAPLEGVAPYKSFGFNVLDALGESMNKTRGINLRPFVSIEAIFLKYFKYSLMYQYEWSQSKTETYDDADSYMMRITHNAMIGTDGKSYLPDGGRYYQSSGNTSRYTLRNQLNFDKTWIDHAVSVIAGLEFRQNKTPRLIQQLMYGYDSQTLTAQRIDWQSFYDGVGTSAITGHPITLGGLTTSQQETRHRYASFYTNASYAYRSRYSLSGSLRWDQADLFGLDIRNQHHPLWSVGAGWLVSEERIMRRVSWLDYLKLRMTYGVNGNVDQSSTTYFVVTQKTQSNPVRTTYLKYNDDDLPNPKLRWEKTATYNVGLDFRAFNNIINGSVEYYNRHASDLLVTRYMDPTSGASSRVVNNGEMRNRGVELSLTGHIIRKKDWDLSTTFTFAHNTNKMLKVDHSDNDAASMFISGPQNYFIEGTSYNTLWAYRIDRIENGYPIAVDKDGNDLVSFNEDGTVKSITTTSALKGTDDLVNMGTLTPTYNGSLALNLRYRDFELNTFFIYSGGNKLRYSVVSMDDQNGSQTLADIANRWQTDGTGGSVRMYGDLPSTVKPYSNIFQSWWQYGDINVKDASYMKLRSISLAYNLPKPVCGKIGLNSAKLTLQVNNLFTWSAAGHGIDPESYSLNSGTRGMTMPKTFAVGVSANF